jgi:RNA methyltransferase, TrmH family
MIGKKKLKQVKSLSLKKYRVQEQLFLAEGDKIVAEVLDSPIKVKELYATEDFLIQNKTRIAAAKKIISADNEDIRKLSLQKQPQNSIALCSLPSVPNLPEELAGLSFFLDGVQDPGNFGTIIRTCDWFGIDYLFCSPDTVDVFNPKVIQSSMGSFCRVNIFYAEFEEILKLAVKSKIPVMGTFTEGENIFTQNLPDNVLIVLGNEGRGIRTSVASKTGARISIPSYSKKSGAESLNVAVTAAIICSQFVKGK